MILLLAARSETVIETGVQCYLDYTYKQKYLTRSKQSIGIGIPEFLYKFYEPH